MFLSELPVVRLSVFILLLIASPRLGQAQTGCTKAKDKNYAIWAQGANCDQQSQKSLKNSGLITWDKNVVFDTNLAAFAMPLVQRNPNPVKFIWVFQQCFGGGMFDELNALGGTQSGVSASNYDARAYYPEFRPYGNGVDFGNAYIEAMRDKTSISLPMASGAADNDPWGVGNAPNPPRVNGVEKQGSELPVYFSIGAGADTLDLSVLADQGAAILWAGRPGYPADSIQLKQAIYRLVALNFKPDRIYVLYGKGLYSTKTDYVAKAVLDKFGKIVGKQQLGPATFLELQNVFGKIGVVDGLNFVFFFATDHGYATGVPATDYVPVGGEYLPIAGDPPVPTPDVEELIGHGGL